HKLILMLYEGAIRFANQAMSHIEQGNIEGKNIAIQRFQDIVFELMSSLNFKEGKEIANNLYTLYSYTIELSNRSSIELNIEPLQEIIEIINDIKSAWAQIAKGAQSHGS